MAGEVEPGTAMLMADNGFLNFCEEELTACLQPQIAGRPDARQRVEGVARRLKELGEKAERHGGTHMGAVWILPVMGAENNRKYGQIIKRTWLSGSGICGQGEFREGLPRPGRKKGLSGM